MNESKFIFNLDLIKMKYIYAFCWNDLWFRGLVIDVDSNFVKVSVNICILQIFFLENSLLCSVLKIKIC